MKVGILDETREPQDNRVPLTPSQCTILKEENPEMDVYVQSSKDIVAIPMIVTAITAST